MRIPQIQGLIRRRLLVNFRAHPEVVKPLLPRPFSPKLHGGYALVGICLIRLEQIRPAGFPAFIGVSSENAAHRIAVEWTDDSGDSREGVYIPRRDSNSWLNRLAGGRIFPGEHHPAEFSVTDRIADIDFSMRSSDGEIVVRVCAQSAEELPADSCFASLREASAFFERGSLGYSASRNPDRSDGLILHTHEWKAGALNVSSVQSSYFENLKKFPKGSVVFDHALVMRDIAHEWLWAEDMDHSPKSSSPL